MKSEFLICVSAAAMALAPTANATNSKPPGAQWEPDFGLGCGFVSGNTDPANPQSTHYEGEADCESVWGPRNPGVPTTRVVSSSVTVKLQTCPHHHPQGPGHPNICTSNTVLWSCTFSGPLPTVAIGACVVAHDNPPSQALYFAVSYHWTESPPPTNYSYMPDSDPLTPGKQASLVTSV